MLDLRYAFTRFKAEKMPSLLLFVACESRSNFTIFPTSLTEKLLFRDMSCNFLTVMLIAIVSLSLSSNKLGNNFNCHTNLLIPMSLLFISNLAIGWLLTITFDLIMSEKCEFQVRYLNKGDFVLIIWEMLIFELKVNSFIKIRLRGQSSIYNFRINEIWTRKTDFFTIHDSFIIGTNNSET